MENNLNIIYSDYIVLGAGAAGLAMANLLADKDKSIAIIEAHSLVGGCGSYFKRQGASFDVGATTLSGIAYNGPLERFHQRINFNPKLIGLDPGVVFSFGDVKLKRFKKIESWIDEQRNVFPNINLDTFWNEIELVNKIAWSMIEDSKAFPPISIYHFYNLFFKNVSSKIKILPHVFKDLKQTFHVQLSDQRFKSFIDEQLLIAAQSDSSQVSTLISAMSLSYMNDIWYPVGGVGGYLKDLFTKLKKNNNVEAFLNTKIVEIEKHQDFFILRSENKIFKCKYLISTVPVWNLLKLIKNFSLPMVKKFSNKNNPKWGALTGYYKIKLKSMSNEVYHQLHLNEKIDFTHSNSVFISLSHPEDFQRVNDDYQTLTVSTHIDLADYYLKTKSVNYSNLKSKWDQILQKVISNYFGDELLDIINCGIGDPQTFEKYTNRFMGTVGGIPHDKNNTIFSFQKSDIGVKNLYLIGDTVFPGQGIVGVFQGAMNLFDRRFAQ